MSFVNEEIHDVDDPDSVHIIVWVPTQGDYVLCGFSATSHSHDDLDEWFVTEFSEDPQIVRTRDELIDH